MREYPHTKRNGKYLKWHRLIVEKAIGRQLKDTEVVHHVDEDKRNNKNDNLVVCEDTSYHRLLHKRLRALRACGNANAFRCRVCKEWDVEGINGMTIYAVRNSTTSAHKSCSARESRLRRRS